MSTNVDKIKAISYFFIKQGKRSICFSESTTSDLNFIIKKYDIDVNKILIRIEENEDDLDDILEDIEYYVCDEKCEDHYEDEHCRMMGENTDKIKAIAYFFTYEQSTDEATISLDFILERYNIDVVGIIARINESDEERLKREQDEERRKRKWDEEHAIMRHDNADKMKALIYFFTDIQSTDEATISLDFILERYNIDVVGIIDRLNGHKERPFSTRDEYRMMMLEKNDADKMKAISYFFITQGQLTDAFTETTSSRLNSIINKYGVDVGGILAELEVC